MTHTPHPAPAPPAALARWFWPSYGPLLGVTGLGAVLAYKTIGEVTAALYLFGILVLQVPLLVLARFSRRWSLAGAGLLALIVLPPQLYLGVRYLRVKAEADRIVAYAYAAKEANGAFPSSLDGYTYHDPEMRRFIQRYQVSERTGDFMLTFRVGTESTSHWYQPTTGWHYYPD